MNEADICILCEGSYPYSIGGVSQWIHELIKSHPKKTFHVLSLAPPHPDLTRRYHLPDNVLSHTTYIVQDLPSGQRASKTPQNFREVFRPFFEGIMSSSSFTGFHPLMAFFQEHADILGKKILSESQESWDLFIELYHTMIPHGPFKAYFATIFTLSRSIYSLLLPPLPKAKVFHAVCTGYAGFLLSRAKYEQNVPCILTEHGVYSNERRIEIAMADWITDMSSLNLDVEHKSVSLKDFWLHAFFSMAHAAYRSADAVLSTFDGNREIQLQGGADPQKTSTVVHGIDIEKYRHLRPKKTKASTVAFIGRIVPIKDVKSFIRACAIVKKQIPDVSFLALGPIDEDPEYVKSCQELIAHLDLSPYLAFAGKVDLLEYLPMIDLIVLTSLSEAQPLVMLEAGAAGIPSVATHVGACHQIIHGSDLESPRFGPGGIVTPLADPDATAAAIIRLLTDSDFYQSCSQNIAQRIQAHYQFAQEQLYYEQLYNAFLQPLR